MHNKISVILQALYLNTEHINKILIWWMWVFHAFCWSLKDSEIYHNIFLIRLLEAMIQKLR
jgi:hypothetical protein